MPARAEPRWQDRVVHLGHHHVRSHRFSADGASTAAGQPSKAGLCCRNLEKICEPRKILKSVCGLGAYARAAMQTMKLSSSSDAGSVIGLAYALPSVSIASGSWA